MEERSVEERSVEERSVEERAVDSTRRSCGLAGTSCGHYKNELWMERNKLWTQ